MNRTGKKPERYNSRIRLLLRLVEGSKRFFVASFQPRAPEQQRWQTTRSLRSGPVAKRQIVTSRPQTKAAPANAQQ